MTHLEKFLWVTKTLSAAFIVLSLTSIEYQPDFFFFGIPFSLAIFVLMVSSSLLSGGTVVHAISGWIPEEVAHRAWQVLAAIMVVRSLVVNIAVRAGDDVFDYVLSVLVCGSCAFFLLIDCCWKSEKWPKFDVGDALRRQPSPPQRSTYRRRPAVSVAIGWKWIRLLSCLLAGLAVIQLAQGLSDCLDSRTMLDEFFISELGIGQSAEKFTSTLLQFGLCMIPFFLCFTFPDIDQNPSEPMKFAVGGSLAVCGIIGIGIWDLHNPRHYLSIAVWLWPMAVILDQQVPTPRGYVKLLLPTWIVKGSMALYVMFMILLGSSNSARSFCIMSQRLVVFTNLLWLMSLLKVMMTESLGLGEQWNGAAE